MMTARIAFVWAGIACGPGAMAQSPPACCTHQGASVMCPPGLPAGSRSLEFVPQGTLWGTPGGQSVMVPSTTFARCAPAVSQPSARPAAPPPITGTTREPAEAPPPAPAPAAVSPPSASPPSAPPSGTATADVPPGMAPAGSPAVTRERDRDRGRPRPGPSVRMPGTPPANPPLVAVPVPPSTDEGKDADAAIGRMGTLLRAQEKERLAEEQSGTTCTRPAPGKGGSGLGIAKGGDTCDCEDPRLMKQEAPAGGKGKGGGAGGGGGGGGAKGPAAAAAFRIEMHLQPHWRTVEAGKTHTLGTGDQARTGTVSGETLFGGIAGMSAMCKVTTAGCRGDCEKVVYDLVHVDLDINIAYVAGHRAQAAHESVHARQIGDVFRKALEGIKQTEAYPCSPRRDTPRRLRLCADRLDAEARRVGEAAVNAWFARRRRLQAAGEYFNDPEEVEAFAEEKNGDAGAVFAPGVEPPAEFAPAPAPAGAASR